MYFFLFTILLFSSFPNQSQAASTEVTSVGNTATTDYAPINKKTGTGGGVSTFGLDFARGTVSCYSISNNVYCPWTIQVGGDVISYSNVTVEIQKDHGFLNGGWEPHKTLPFNYRINTPSSTIRNEGSTTLSDGAYRARLGGTFTTVKNGVYGAWANGWSYFEVK